MPVCVEICLEVQVVEILFLGNTSRRETCLISLFFSPQSHFAHKSFPSLFEGIETLPPPPHFQVPTLSSFQRIQRRKQGRKK